MKPGFAHTVASSFTLFAALAATATAQQPVDRWLVLGPLPAATLQIGSSGTGAVLDALPRLHRSWPEAGDEVRWVGGRTVRWEERAAPDGVVDLNVESGPTRAYLVTYLDAGAWQEAELELVGATRAWLDGAPVASGRVRLEQAKHRLLIESVRSPADSGRWRVGAKWAPRMAGGIVSATTEPRRRATWLDLAARPQVTAVRVDPTGARVALVVRTLDEELDRWSSRIEVRELARGSLVAELRLARDASLPAWSRDGLRLAFATPTDRADAGGLDLWIWSPGEPASERLLRGERGLADVHWSPDGEWIYFSATAKAEEPPETGPASRVTELWERWSHWPEKRRLHAVHVSQGTRVELAGDAEYSVNGATISPDGRTIVFTRDVHSAVRPFVQSEIWLLELASLEMRRLFDLRREVFVGPSRFAWSPDGEAIAFCASAKQMLDSDDAKFSVFENDLYVVTLADGRLHQLSAGFQPDLSCGSLQWAADGRIHLGANTGGGTVPARTTQIRRPGDGSVQLETWTLPADVLGAHDVAGGWFVGVGESLLTPGVVYKARLTETRATPLHAPARGWLEQLDLPAARPWRFTSAAGFEIDGWYLTPPAMDTTQRHPLVVFYYGGTAPTKRGFDERLLWYASLGYVVYVLNPAGAPGYGQDFSNLHIDDWGYPAATDIIEGVTRFAAEHPFIDRQRIGNFGHSYGGFMTMHLLTRTDLFRAAASLAGISNIAGYWGTGWWGYVYTEGTCPGCFPWNRPDVFIERSPLFQADRVRTPLLLIHGMADTNVPPSESEQMFTALRVLGREVEFVRVAGEDHGIDSKPSVTRLRDTLMLEWFDKHLRDRPAAWNARWNPAAPATPADRPTPTQRSR